MPEIIVKLGDRVIHRYFFDKDALSVGRARDNDIVIENLSVSRNHAKIKKQDGKFVLTDMNSANGTLVNGVRVSKTELVHDDVVTVGKHTLLFLETVDSAAADLAPQIDRTPAPDPKSPAELAIESSVGIPLTGIVGVLRVGKGKQEGQEFRVFKDETTIGRAGENDIRLHDWFVSKKHAAIVRKQALFTLRDLDSWRGTTVNGNSIKEIDLSEGDEVVFGTTVLSFHMVEASQLAELPPPPPLEAEENYESDSSLHHGLLEQVEADQESEELAGPDSDEDDLSDADDEFAPMTEDELEALELDAELHAESDDEEEEHRKAMWEMLEAEKMFEMGGEGDQKKFSLVEDDEELRRQEEAAVPPPPPVNEEEALDSDLPNSEEEQEEEEALYGGAMTDDPPMGESSSAAAHELRRSTSTSLAGEAVSREVLMWEKALKNKSAVIRRNAAKELKKLTGIDHDWKSEPGGS